MIVVGLREEGPASPEEFPVRGVEEAETGGFKLSGGGRLFPPPDAAPLIWEARADAGGSSETTGEAGDDFLFLRPPVIMARYR